MSCYWKLCFRSIPGKYSSIESQKLLWVKLIDALGTVNVKYKVHPITGHESPKEKYRYSSTLSLTSTLDGAGWSTPRLVLFSKGKDPSPIV
jgi:hypothetical protein